MAPQATVERDPVGEMLMEAQLITKADLDAAMATHHKTGERVTNILLSQGALDTQDFVKFLARPSQTGRVDFKQFDITPDIVASIPKEFAIEHQVVPVSREGDELTVAAATPLDREVLKSLSEQIGAKVKMLICSTTDVDASINRYYKSDGSSPDAGSIIGPLKLAAAVSMLHNIEALPALPRTVHLVRDRVYDDDGSTAEVGEIISHDPAISAKMLKVANSAAFGFTHKVDNVPLAVSLLGMSETYSIVVSSAVVNVFDTSSSFDYKNFWLFSMTCGNVARELAKRVPGQSPSGVFSAGMLHDIGRPALVQIAPRHYEQVDPDLTGNALVQAEERAIGLCHTEAGYELALHWDLPRELVECIRFHHMPEFASDENRAIVSIINVAAVLARAHVSQSTEVSVDFAECAEGMNFLGLDEEAVMEAYEAVPPASESEALWLT